MIKDGDKFVNPNKIENTKTYVVNTGIIQVNQYLAGPDGKPSSVLGEPESVYGTIGEETVIKPFESKYYDPVSGEVKAVIQENRTSIDMLYKKNEEKTPDNVKIDLIHAKDYPLDQPANNPYGLVSKSYGNKYPFILKLDGMAPETIVNNADYWMTEDKLPKKDGKTDWSQVTAFKVIGSKDNTIVLNGKSSYSITLPMQAPVYQRYSLDDMRAYNTFAVRYSASSIEDGVKNQKFVEGNEVYIYMKSPRGSVDIYKTGNDLTKPKDQQEQKLEGAVFRIYHVYNKVLDRNKDVNDEKLFRPLEIDGKTYYVSTEPMSFTDENNQTYVDVKTDKYGYAHFGDLKYDRDYVVEEAAPPKGYKIDEKSRYNLVAGERLSNKEGVGITYKLNVENEKIYNLEKIEPLRGTVELRKLDKSGKPLPNTIFKLEGGTKKTPVYRYATASETGLVRFEYLPLFGKTDADGNEIPPYKIYEVGPRGALEPIEVMTFRLTNRKTEDGKADIKLAQSLMEGGKIDEIKIDKAGNPTYSLEPVKNDKAKLKLYKIGIFKISDQEKNPSELKNSYGKRLSGVKIKIKGVFEGSILPETKEFTTGSDGSIELSGLKVGKTYEISEDSLPKGYRYTPPKKDAEGNMVPDKKTTISLRVDNLGNIYLNDNLSNLNYGVIPNYPEKNTNRIDIRKTDDSNNVLSDVTFGLYEVKNPGKSDENLVRIQEKQTDNEGQLFFEDFGMTDDGKDYIQKTFEVKEEGQKPGYLPRFESFRFTTNGTTSTYYSLDPVNPEIQLSVLKTENGKKDAPVAGTEFSLYEGPDGTGKVLAKAVTDNDGKAVFDYHEYDINKQYSVKETKIPDGFGEVSKGKVYLFDLKGLKESRAFKGKYEIEATNIRTRGSIQIEKLDNQSHEPIAGPQFGLFEEGGSEPLFTGKTGKDGVLIFDKLEPGKTYTVKEINPPAGYVLNKNNSENIKINSAERIRRTYYNSRVDTELVINKTDGNGGLVKDAQFTLDERYALVFYRNAVVKTSDENGAVTFNKLQQGRTYRLRETSADKARLVSDDSVRFMDNDSVWCIEVLRNKENPDQSDFRITDKNGKEVKLDSSGKLTVANKPIKTKDITVTKTWKDSPSDHPAAYFKLTRKLEGNLQKEDAKDVTGKSCEILKAEGDNPFTENCKWTKLPETDSSGKAYTYYVEEVDKNGNPLKLEDYTMGEVNADGDNFTVTNTYKHTDLSAEKIWDDNDNQDGKRKDVKLHLTKQIGNGSAVKVDGSDKTIDKNASGAQLTAKWSDLPIYEDGQLISYNVVENQILEYTSEVKKNSDYSFTVTNTHTPELTDINAEKVWKDNDNQDGMRKDVVLVLSKKADDQLAHVKVEGSERVIDKDASGDALKVTWKNLPKYEGGKLLTYNVVEGEIPEYTSEVKNNKDYSFTLTNSHTPETTVIKATKVWNDADNQDGKRKDIVLHIEKRAGDGEFTEVENSKKTIGKSSQGEDLTAVWDKMPVYEGGKKLEYKVVEENAPEGYETAGNKIKGKDYEFEVTNSYTPEKVQVTAQKVWDDKDNQDGKRAEVKLHLTKQTEGSKVVKVSGSDKTIKADASGDELKAVWENLPKYESGKLISYQVEEEDIPEYTSSVEKNSDYSFTVTNKHVPEVTDLYVTKVWDDKDNQDGKRAEITFYLTKEVEGQPVKVEHSEKTLAKDASGDDLIVKWENLPKYEGGELLNYNF